jgi:hypothetical protein
MPSRRQIGGESRPVTSNLMGGIDVHHQCAAFGPEGLLQVREGLFDHAAWPYRPVAGRDAAGERPLILRHPGDHSGADRQVDAAPVAIASGRRSGLSRVLPSSIRQRRVERR